MKKLLMTTLACLAACTDPEPTGEAAGAGSASPVVIASNYPLYYFAQWIAVDAIDVRFPVIEGDPANWSPSGEQAGDLQAQVLIVRALDELIERRILEHLPPVLVFGLAGVDPLVLGLKPVIGRNDLRFLEVRSHHRAADAQHCETQHSRTR